MANHGRTKNLPNCTTEIQSPHCYFFSFLPDPPPPHTPSPPITLSSKCNLTTVSSASSPPTSSVPLSITHLSAATCVCVCACGSAAAATGCARERDQLMSCEPEVSQAQFPDSSVYATSQTSQPASRSLDSVWWWWRRWGVGGLPRLPLAGRCRWGTPAP